MYYTYYVIDKRLLAGAFSFMDSSLDLVDACHRASVLKVIGILAFGGDPNMTHDDEPLFIILINKILELDALTQTLRVEDTETPYRKKFTKILNAFAMYHVNLNTLDGYEGFAPIHLAARAGNMKLVKWLVTKGALVDLHAQHNQESVTAAMLAAKYGHVEMLALILRLGASLLSVDNDGRTPLHYAGM